MNKKVIIIAACFAILAIIIDAFGAHWLKKSLSFEQLNSYKTGTKYHLIHSVVLFITGLNYDKINQNKFVVLLLIFGILFFSFSIYLLSLQDYLNINLSFLGSLTPIGGLFFILAWFLVIFLMLKHSK